MEKNYNNGWIKIESEADLPKDDCWCWFLTDLEYRDIEQNIMCLHFNSDNNTFSDLEYSYRIQYYQHIIKPLKPIY